MAQPWPSEQVLALAPDATSAAAGRALSHPAPWSGTGACDLPPALWGECQGSGRTPYQTAVDLSEPAFRCSCPSRKFPCKHALGLMLLWSSEGLATLTEAPDWVSGWITERAERAASSAERAVARAAQRGDAEGRPGPADPVAAAKRFEQRAARMAAGVEQLDLWLRDAVRGGLSGVERGGYAVFDGLAARLVDAQLPGAAAWVRRLAAIPASGDGWPGRLLEEYALLRLLVSAYRRLPELDRPLAATVAAHLGAVTPVETVLAEPAVRDRWAVLALRDAVEDRLSSRRVWLRGERTARLALVLSFAMTGQSLDASLVPGRVVDAELHYYPGAAPLRAVVGRREGLDDAMAAVPGISLDDALDSWAAALARDPWTRSWPVVLAGVQPALQPGEAGHASSWVLLDPAGRTLAIRGVDDAQVWTLVAACGGHPGTVLAELVPDGVRPVCALDALVEAGATR